MEDREEEIKDKTEEDIDVVNNAANDNADQEQQQQQQQQQAAAVVVDEETRRRLDIARRFLANSPPGEVHEVAEALRALNVDVSAAEDAFREFNLAQMSAIAVPELEHKVLIAKHGELDAKTYFEPSASRVITVDHVQQICTDVRDAMPDERTPSSAEPYTASIEAALRKHAKQFYSNGECAVYACNDDIDATTIHLTLCLASAKFSPRNFWNGQWQAVWEGSIRPNERIAELKGSLKVDVHYFEEGNVRLRNDYACMVTAVIESEQQAGEAIVSAVRDAEASYLAGLEEVWAELPNVTAKELRRKLPITRTQFSWSSMVHKVAQELRGKSHA